MSPRSLLFSSDQETSQRLAQALQELELEAEFCSEIFEAVKQLTAQHFEVVVADWDQGMEAAFFLQTARDLKLNRKAFAIAIAPRELHAAAQQAGAQLVLCKPVLPGYAKYALLSSPEFFSRLQAWHVSETVPVVRHAAISAAGPKLWPATPAARPKAAAQAPVPPSPKPRIAAAAPRPKAPERQPQPLPWSGFEPVFDTGRMEKLYRRTRQRIETPPFIAALGSRSFLRGTAASLVLASLTYFGGSLWGAKFGNVMMAGIFQHELPASESPGAAPLLAAPASAIAGPGSISTARSRLRIRIAPAQPGFRTTPAESAPAPAAAPGREPSSAQPSTASMAEDGRNSATAALPESLRTPTHIAGVRDSASSPSPSVLNAIQPVSLTEDMSDDLLVEKVLPDYPEEAIRSGQQGKVVLEVWVAPDGTVRDLKLVSGPLVLGRAAYDAVKHWRYRPYIMNGHAVEATTYVTVAFKMPDSATQRAGASAR